MDAVAPVLDMGELAADPHIIERGALTEIGGVTQQGLVAGLSRTPGAVRWAGRGLGSDDVAKPGADETWLTEPN